MMQQHTPHPGAAHLPLATPSPRMSADMAPHLNKSNVLPRTVSLSPAEQSDESESSKSPVTLSLEKSDVTASDAMEVMTEDVRAKDSTQLRRSSREKKSTLVYIDGQAVLAKNNYRMKGHAYQYGTGFETAPPKPAKKKSTTQTKAAPKPRTVTQQEKKRLNHNAAVKRRVESKSKSRSPFLLSNLTTLDPFLQESVAAQLRRAARPKSAKSNEKEELYMQPEAIQADMRDYQLAGLNWMVKMHESNLGMILGDEMVSSHVGSVVCIPFCNLPHLPLVMTLYS